MLLCVRRRLFKSFFLFFTVQELLGDKLVVAPASGNETALPSPNQLKYKIIIKNKKLRTFTANPVVGNNSLTSNRSFARMTTMEDNVEDDYDSDYGDEEEEDLQGMLLTSVNYGFYKTD